MKIKLKAFVAFGDIRGFSSFYEAISDEESELDPFLDDFDTIIEELGEKHRVKDTGDGFMLILDMSTGHNCHAALRLLDALWAVHKSMDRLITRKQYPYPDGFRITLACGRVSRKIKKDGTILERGKHINLAHKMLRIKPPRGIVCHESFRQLISPLQARRYGYAFKRMTLEATPDGISEKDAAVMWEVRKLRGKFDRRVEKERRIHKV